MARNGSGTYNLLTNSWNPATNGVSATATDWQNLINDVAAALTQSLSADGQTPMTGNLNAGNNKITGLAAGTATGDSLRWEQLFSQGQPANLASAATTDIGAQNTVLLNITGTTTITSFGTNYNGPRYLRFDGVLTLTHNATTLILPGGANITTAAGDSAIVVPNGTPANGWRVLGYERADGVNNATSKIQPISATITSNQIIVSASALTLDFRSTTLTSGTVTTVIGTPANLTIASTDSFGLVTASGNQRIAILAINNAGTIELAAASLFGSQALDETGVITTVTAATTGAQIKSATARTNVAYRVIGFVDATFTTGTGWGSLTVVQGQGGVNLIRQTAINLGTSVASTSGTSIDFTGIPSWVRRITVMFDGVSISGADNILIRTGSGSFDTSGYLNSGSYLGASTVSTVSSTAGYLVQSGGASNIISGCLNIVMLRPNSWTVSGVFGFSNTAAMSMTAGTRGTSGALDRIRITTTGGTDTFDAGTINISWE